MVASRLVYLVELFVLRAQNAGPVASGVGIQGRGQVAAVVDQHHVGLG